MVNQIRSSFDENSTQNHHTLYAMLSTKNSPETPSGGDTRILTKNTTPSSSRRSSAQRRKKSGSSRPASRQNSNGSRRPTTAASVDSILILNGGQKYQDCSDENEYHQDESTRVTHHMTDEGRLSRCLKSWMPDYELRSLPPQPNPPREAVFSARLGDHLRVITRSTSTESISTQLSLFSCSSHGSNSAAAAAKQRRRRRRRMKEDQENECGDPEKSIWVELASKTGGALDKMMRMHAIYAQMDTETAIFQKLPDHEKALVTEAGTQRGFHLGPGRQRSDSASNIHKKLPPPKPIRPVEIEELRRRLQSADGKIRGPMTNFQELRRQMVNQRLASLQEKFSKHRQSSRRSLTGTKSVSRHSPCSSSSNNDVFQSNTPLEGLPSSREIEQSKDFEIDTADCKNDQKEDAQVSVWKGDSQILAIDLQRELTAKVKSKIESTTTALERATGLGDDNSPQSFVGPLEEYPNLVEQDYSQVARIPQRIRISPHLSDVIRTDIHVRMGRPRYHEIRIHDLAIWNRGTDLDRSHRNLKVFNWLHSLRETEFDLSLPEGVQDDPPGGNIKIKDEVVVAVDEPEIKPLFERLKKERYIV